MLLAIRLPDDLERRICSFPFLQALVKGLRAKIARENEERDESEMDSLSVHLIAEKQNIEALNLLPFNAFYHELEKEDLKSVFTAHRAVKNLKLDHVDVYLSLSESFVDASMGKSLSAPIRAGFSTGKNSLFFNRKTSLLKGRHYCEQYHPLLNLFLDDVPEIPAKGFSRELEPTFPDWRERPYYVINLPFAKGGEIDERWMELFSLAEGERFVLMCDSIPLDAQKEALDAFARKANPANEYIAFELEDLIEFAKIAAYAQLFVTKDSPLLLVAAYAGAHAYYLAHGRDSADRQQTSGPVYFLGDVRYFNMNEPVYREGGEPAYHKVFDELLEFFDRNKAQVKSSARQKDKDK